MIKKNSKKISRRFIELQKYFTFTSSAVEDHVNKEKKTINYLILFGFGLQ
jgi:hypothetical protein